MAVKDYVSPVTKLKQAMLYDPKEFANMIVRSIKDRGYSGYLENAHNEYNNPDGTKTIFFAWNIAKKVEPYVRVCIDLSVKEIFSDATIEKEGMNENLHEGTIDVEIVSYLMRDVEDEWGYRNGSPTRRFLRDLYDKVFNADKLNAHEKKLKGDVDALISDLKAYMKLHQPD